MMNSSFRRWNQRQLYDLLPFCRSIFPIPFELITMMVLTAAVIVVPLSLIVLLYHLVWRFLNTFRVDVRRKAVLITGCDSGFGYELALKCVRDGMDVFATCFTEEGPRKLKECCAEFSKTIPIEECGGSIETISMDVRSQDSIDSAAEFVRDKLGPNRGLWALVNNAGIVGGNVAWDDWLRPEDYEDTWQVNAMGVIRVTHAFKGLVKAEKGRIISTASVCGRIALPALGPYSVSKFALEAYCDTLRVEMHLFDVKVIILEPGFYNTPLTNVERNKEMLGRVWSRLPEALKNEYGEAFFKFSCKALSVHLGMASEHTEWVVDAYRHAISARWPHPRYQIGYDANLVYIPLASLPTRLQDGVFKILGMLQKPPFIKTKKKAENLLLTEQADPK